jgi:hypothetical protein
LTPTHANKKGRRYRYYVTHSLIKRGQPRAADSARRVPAGDLERLVEERIVSFLRDEGALHDARTGMNSEVHEIATLIAAAKTGRRGYGIELDPRYCDVIIRRVVAATGTEAIHAATGKPFAEIARERAAEAAVEPQPDQETPTVEEVE